MPLLEFETSRLRIDRADTHRKAFAEFWNRMIEEDGFYQSSVSINGDGTGVVSVFPYGGMPDILSFELGEMLYQFRAALDACIYGAAIRESGKNPPPDEEKLEFPVCASIDTFNRSAYKIGPLPEKLKALIEFVQPYNIQKATPEELIDSVPRNLQILHDWSRKDRHRQLHLVTSWISKIQPLFRLPPGVVLESLTVRPEGRLEGQDEIASFVLSGYREE